MPYVIVCDDYIVPANSALTASSTGMTGTVWPTGTTRVNMGPAVSCVGVPKLLDLNTIEQVAHPLLTASDYAILSSAVVLALATAWSYKAVRKVL